MEKELIKAAIEYSEKFNYPVIPCNPKDKRPLIKWSEFQKRKTTNDEIKSWWNKWPEAMIGCVTGKISGDFVIDIDNLEGEENLQEYISDTLLTPTSITPRGGKHIHFENPDEEITIGAALFPHVDYRGSGGFCMMPPSKNSEGKQYSWMEGLSLDDIPRSPLPQSLLSFIKDKALSLSYYYRENVTHELQSVTSVTNSNILFNEGMRDQGLFHIANQLIKSKTNEKTVRQLLKITALYGCDPPFPLNDVEIKIQSAIERAMRKERHLTQEIRDWVSVTNGNICVTNAYQELQIVTKEEKNKARVIFRRLVEEEKVLERVGDKDGWYRRIENEIEEMKWWEASGKEIQLGWPFELENYFRTLTKNIIVISGSPDSGKTAFLLNFCLNNMDKNEIFYFTSEASDEEINDRLKEFGVPNYKERFRKVKFYPKSHDFHDLIKANSINIIDYLEMPEEPWKIGIFIRKIHDKLDKGICLIALQKPLSRDIARGGEVTLDKPKLYISIGKDQYGDHVIKIIKCKNWRNKTNNPNGLSRTFKLIAGCKFIMTSDWSIPWSDTSKK